MINSPKENSPFPWSLCSLTLWLCRQHINHGQGWHVWGTVTPQDCWGKRKASGGGKIQKEQKPASLLFSPCLPSGILFSFSVTLQTVPPHTFLTQKVRGSASPTSPLQVRSRRPRKQRSLSQVSRRSRTRIQLCPSRELSSTYPVISGTLSSCGEKLPCSSDGHSVWYIIDLKKYQRIKYMKALFFYLFFCVLCKRHCDYGWPNGTSLLRLERERDTREKLRRDIQAWGS